MSPTFVRLAGAVVASLSACGFVSTYSFASLVIFQKRAERVVLPGLAELLVDYGAWSYAVPVLLLLAGAWVLRRRHQVGVEVVVTSGWLFALIWVCYALVAWCVAGIPVLRPHG